METKSTISKSAPDVYEVSGIFFPGSVITLMGDDGHPLGAIQISTHAELNASFKLIPFTPKN